MLQTRIIPVLLIHKGGLYKTKKFKKPKYVGDPINAIKIFNEKEVDELILLDIDASKENKEPNYKLIEDIASECFMPLCYGGGVKNLEQIKKIFSFGVEKISLNNILFEDDTLVKKAVEIYGSQSIVASVDINKTIFGKHAIYNYKTKKHTTLSYCNFINKLEKIGIGEILINCVYNDGMQTGYDLELLKIIANEVAIPVIALGGASSLEDFKKVIVDTEVSALAAGSMFVFHGKHQAVLIKYPKRDEIEKTLKEKIE
jgi:imidazole glycerol-phosphate synthase subunit HisF